MPCVRGVPRTSPITLPESAPITMTWVARETNTRPVPGSAVR